MWTWIYYFGHEVLALVLRLKYSYLYSHIFAVLILVLMPPKWSTHTSTHTQVSCTRPKPASRSFSHEFTIKLLKYGTSCPVCSTACTVLDGFFPYLAQMITSMRGCVACNDLWPWPISSKLQPCYVCCNVFQGTHIPSIQKKSLLSM